MKKIFAFILVLVLAFSGCETVFTEKPENDWQPVEETEEPESSEEAPQVPENEENTLKGAGDYTEEELEYFKIIYRNYSTVDDLYTNDFVSEGFEHRYNFVKEWLELSAGELCEIAEYGNYGDIGNYIVCPEINSVIYMLHDQTEYEELQIGMTCFFIMHNKETAENKLIFANNYGLEGVALCGKYLVMNERTELLAVDLSTGEMCDVPIDFDFGEKSEYSTEFEVLGLDADKETGNIILAYYDTKTMSENQFAKVWLKVFDKDGKLLRTIDTGTEARVQLGHFWYNVSQIAFWGNGKVSMQFPYAKGGYFPYECNYLTVSEEPEVGEISELWKIIEGRWYCNEFAQQIFFYFSDGKACVNYVDWNDEWPDVYSSIFYITGFEEISDGKYKISTEDKDGRKPSFYIDTHKMLIGIKNEDYNEFEKQI